MYELLKKYSPTFNANGLGGGGGIQMPSFGDGGGGDGGDSFVDDNGGGQQGNLIGDDSGDDDGDDDLSSILNAFNDPEGDDDDDDDSGNNNNNAGDIDNKEVEALESEIKNLIGNMQFPMAKLPENFDPSDRGQMQAVMTSAIQASVAQALNVVFKPVQLGMKQMAAQLNANIESKISSSRNQMNDRSILESIVPEVNDEKYAAMITTMDSALAGKGKKAKDRATAIRKVLNQMGVKGEVRDGNNRRMTGGGNGGGESNRSVRHGHAALDGFFGKFDFTGGQGNRGGNNNGGRQNGGGQNRR